MTVRVPNNDLSAHQSTHQRTKLTKCIDPVTKEGLVSPQVCEPPQISALGINVNRFQKANQPASVLSIPPVLDGTSICASETT